MLNLENQTAKANLFRDLHRGPKMLVLPNAWDVASARILEEAGVAAIATTSAGIAFALGYPDGQKISREEMLAIVTRIAAKIRIPVTADVEAGYGDFFHDHLFDERGSITVMRDVVQLEAPLGLMGWIAERLILRGYIKELLIKRNRHIRSVAEGEDWKLYLR